MDTEIALGRKQPTSPTSTRSDTAGLDAELAELIDLDLHALRVRWRKLLRTSPPAHLSRPLLLRILAYRLQARLFGDLDRDTERYLDRIARASVRRRTAEKGGRSKSPPPIPPVPPYGGLKPGTLLFREFEGDMYTVTVVGDGFSWNGSTYKSLSEIARLITGTRWNGPRFFGLRERMPRAAPLAEGVV